MPIDKAIDDLAKVLLSRQNMVQAGKYFAEGLQSSGVNSGFQASNPTGTGTAGGRGASDDAQKTQKQATKNLETEIRIRKVLNSQYADHSTLIKNLSSALKHIQPEMSEFGDSLTQIGGAVTDRLQHVSDSFETYEKQIKFWNKVRNKTGLDINVLEEKRTRILQHLQTGTKHDGRLKEILKKIEERRVKILDKANDLQEKNNSLLQRFGKTAMLALGLDAARKFATDVSAQFKYGSIGGIGQQQLRSVSLGGIDPSALSEMSAGARMAAIALGGQTEMYDVMQAKQWANIKVTGDATEAARHTTEMLQLMGRAGIRPSLKGVNQLTEQFGYLHRMTGMTAEQYRATFTALTQNADIRQKLQGLDKKDRRARLEGIWLRFKENVALGMIPEQAQKAAEALAGMAGEGPKERFKKAAQLQMAAGALGISGGAEAAEALRAGDRATKEQTDVLDRVLKGIANARVKSRTADGIHTEFAIERLTRDLQEVGKDSPFVTTLTEALRPEGEIAKGIKTTAEQGGAMNKTLIGIAASVTFIQNLMTTSALGSAIGSTAGFFGLKSMKHLATAGRGIGAMVTGGGAAVAGGGVMAGLGQAGRFGTKALSGSKALMRGGVLGTILAAVAHKGYKFYTDDEEREKTTMSWGRVMTQIQAKLGSEDAQYRLDQMDKQLEQEQKEHQQRVDLETPAKQTAETSVKQLTEAQKQTIIAQTSLEIQIGTVSKENAQARIANMDNQASVV